MTAAIALPASAASRKDTPGLTLTLFVLLAAITAIPILSVDVPPLGDFPNHLARMYILHDGGQSPFLSRYYQIQWAILPNLAMDLIVPPLLGFLPLFAAGKLFLGLTLLIDITGMIALHRSLFGRVSPWPLLGFLLLYNQVVLVGFVNFLFGVGLAFWTAAFWALLRPRRPALAVPLTAILAVAVFFCHMEALMFLGILLFGIEAVGATKTNFLGRALMLAAVFVPAGLFFLNWHTVSQGNLGFRAPWLKLVHLFWVFDNYHPAFDLACVFGYIAFFAASFASGQVRAAGPLKYWLGISIAAFVASPDTVFGGASADIRLPLFIAMLPVVGLEPAAKAGSRFLLIAGLGAALVFGIRTSLLEQVWINAKTLYAGDIAALNMLPRGAKLACSYDWNPHVDPHADIPQMHMPMLAVPLREAFVPTIFAYQGLQPLKITKEFADLPALAPTEIFWAAFVGDDKSAQRRAAGALPWYDYIVFYDKKPITVRPTSCLSFVQGVPSFQLYKINKTPGACTADRL